MTVDLRIERLVLDGASFASVDPARLGEAVRAYLAERLARESRLEPVQAHDRLAVLHGAGVVLSAQATAAGWGRSIADSVHGALMSGGGRTDAQGVGKPLPQAASFGQDGMGSGNEGRAR